MTHLKRKEKKRLLLHVSSAAVSSHLEVNVNVIPEDVHAEELAGADLAGVLLIAVSQQMLVHVTPTGEHLFTQTHTRMHVSDKALPLRIFVLQMFGLQCRGGEGGLTLPQMGQGDGSFLYLVPSSPLASSSSLFMCFGPVTVVSQQRAKKT